MRTATVIGTRAIVVIAVALTIGVLVATESAASTSSAAAPAGPGTQSYLDVARKDCFGTARNTTSKVWFTVADGVLSDTFSPTIQNSNVNTLQYIVTDGRSFIDMQQRDMTYTVSSPDRSGMVCQVTSRDRKHGFALVTDYLTDPARDSVVMHTTLEPLPRHTGPRPRPAEGLCALRRPDRQHRRGREDQRAAEQRGHQLGHGRAGLSDTTRPTGQWAAQVVGALTANRRFERASSGFVGTPSDGLAQLDTYHPLRTVYDSATDGNVVQTAKINDPTRPFTLALGFAPTANEAVATAQRQRDHVIQRDACELRGWLACLRRGAERPTAGRGPRLLAGGQRDQGRRGQDQPGRVCCGAGRPVGTVDAGGHHTRGIHVSVRVRSRQLRDVHRAARRRRPDQRPADGRVPVRPRTAAGRELPARLRARRIRRSGHIRPVRDRRGRVPAADGVGARALRGTSPSTTGISGPTPTSSWRTAPPTARTGGRSTSRTRHRRSQPKSPGSPPPLIWPRQPATRRGRCSTRQPPTTTSAT